MCVFVINDPCRRRNPITLKGDDCVRISGWQTELSCTAASFPLGRAAFANPIQPSGRAVRRAVQGLRVLKIHAQKGKSSAENPKLSLSNHVRHSRDGTSSLLQKDHWDRYRPRAGSQTDNARRHRV